MMCHMHRLPFETAVNNCTKQSWDFMVHKNRLCMAIFFVSYQALHQLEIILKLDIKMVSCALIM